MMIEHDDDNDDDDDEDILDRGRCHLRQRRRDRRGQRRKQKQKQQDHQDHQDHQHRHRHQLLLLLKHRPLLFFSSPSSAVATLNASLLPLIVVFTAVMAAAITVQVSLRKEQ